MNIPWAIFLGILQGLTEFAPVSSSGHLVLVQNLIPGFSQPRVLFDVVLHLGTVVAVLVFFRKTIFKLGWRYIIYIVIATIPILIIGLIFRSSIVGIFSNSHGIGYTLILSGCLNYLVSKSLYEKKSLDNKKSFWIGAAQAFAIIPGISRSGATIFAGVKQGLEPKEAAQFSFLLSVPAILGANLLEVFMNLGEQIDYGLYLIGFLTAFVSGVLAIKIVLEFLQKRKFKVFAYYCLILGLIVLLL